MASIQTRDRSPYWIAAGRDIVGKPFSKSTGILIVPPDPGLAEFYKERAQAIADRYEQRAKKGLPLEEDADQDVTPVAGVPSFNGFAPEWIRTLGGESSYHRKADNYMENVGRFLGIKADWALYRLVNGHFLGLVPFLLDLEYSLTTVRHYQQMLHALFIAAENRGYILASPLTQDDYVQNLKPNLIQPFDLEQVQHIVNSILVVDWRTAILLGYCAGMDLLEAVGIDWASVDFEQHSISWTCHTRNGEPIEMSLPLHPVLETHLSSLKQRVSSPHVTPKLQAMSEATLREHFKKLLEAAHFHNPAKAEVRRRRLNEFAFSSFKRAFAKGVGHDGVFRLARFLRNLTADDLRAKVTGLPALQLRSLPLLNHQ